MDMTINNCLDAAYNALEGRESKLQVSQEVRRTMAEEAVEADWPDCVDSNERDIAMEKISAKEFLDIIEDKMKDNCFVDSFTCAKNQVYRDAYFEIKVIEEEEREK